MRTPIIAVCTLAAIAAWELAHKANHHPLVSTKSEKPEQSKDLAAPANAALLDNPIAAIAPPETLEQAIDETSQKTGSQAQRSPSKDSFYAKLIAELQTLDAQMLAPAASSGMPLPDLGVSTTTQVSQPAAFANSAVDVLAGAITDSLVNRIQQLPPPAAPQPESAAVQAPPAPSNARLPQLVAASPQSFGDIAPPESLPTAETSPLGELAASATLLATPSPETPAPEIAEGLNESPVTQAVAPDVVDELLWPDASMTLAQASALIDQTFADFELAPESVVASSPIPELFSWPTLTSAALVPSAPEEAAPAKAVPVDSVVVATIPTPAPPTSAPTVEAAERSFAEWVTLCRLMQQTQKFTDALAACEQAIALNPQDAAVWVTRGDILAALGNPQAAIAAYDRALAITPQDARLWTHKGAFLSKLGQPETALTFHEWAIRLQPKEALTWANQGETLWQLQRYEEALASAERATSLDPQAAQGWLVQSKALQSLKRPDEAVVAYQRAAQIEASRKIPDLQARSQGLPLNQSVIADQPRINIAELFSPSATPLLSRQTTARDLVVPTF